MMTTRIARELGLDGNPLRRRTDKIGARLAALQLTVFLIGAPFLSVAAVGWAAHHWSADLRAKRSWRQVSAVLLQGAAAPVSTGRIVGYYQVLDRWTTPDGRARTGRLLVSADMLARRTVPLWVDSAGSPTGFPLNHRCLVLAHETTAAAVATMALGIVLLCLAWAGRWVLDRSRLADREAAWAAVGPEWTKRFPSRG
jgi:hypothetical protein